MRPRDEAAGDRPIAGSAAISGEPGQALPRVIVTVTLANARSLFEEALERATRQTAPRFQKLAQFQIDQYAFDRKCAERAADYRLRGPG